MRPHKFGDESGATAIEFAILAPVFIMLLMAIVDFGILYFTNSRVERSVFVAEQKLADGWKPESYAALRTFICQEADINCAESGLHIEVQPLSATSPLPDAPLADSMKLEAGRTHVLRLSYPRSAVFPKSLLSIAGLESLFASSINAGFFFYVKS